MVVFEQTASSAYPPRTFANAKSADLTLAFAVDFTTPGEQLTKKAAGNNYFAIESTQKISQSVALLTKLVEPHMVLNIAGNAMPRFSADGWCQDQVNWWVFRVLRGLKFTSVVCGGQTGADWAGAVAAYALKKDVKVLMPRGFLQRDEHNRDVTNTEEELKSRLVRDSFIFCDG